MNSNIKHHPLLSLSSLLSFFTLELLVAGYLSPSSLQKHQHHPVFQHSSLMSVSLEEKEIQEEIYDFTSHGQTIYLLKPHNVEDPNCKCVSCIEQTFTIKKTDNVETSFHPQKKKTKGRYKAGVLGYALLGEPTSKYDFVVYYGKGDPLVNKKERLAGRRE